MLSTNKASDSIVVVNGRLIDNTPWANKHLQLQEKRIHEACNRVRFNSVSKSHADHPLR